MATKGGIMQPIDQTATVSKGRLWAGRIISILPALFLIVDAVMKLIKPAPVVEATVKLGYSESVIVPLGIVLLISTILYLIPRTAVLGAILLTGYLGGAVDAHVHAGEVGSILFPIVFGILLWLGLYLRDPWLGKLVPIHQ
jgi:DoxX-like protein